MIRIDTRLPRTHVENPGSCASKRSIGFALKGLYILLALQYTEVYLRFQTHDVTHIRKQTSEARLGTLGPTPPGNSDTGRGGDWRRRAQNPSPRCASLMALISPAHTLVSYGDNSSMMLVSRNLARLFADAVRRLSCVASQASSV